MRLVRFTQNGDPILVNVDRLVLARLSWRTRPDGVNKTDLLFAAAPEGDPKGTAVTVDESLDEVGPMVDPPRGGE